MHNHDPITEEFIQKLANTVDDDERARLLSYVKLKAVQVAPEAAFEAPITTLGEYLDTPIKLPPVLVQPTFLVRGGLNSTIGRAGKGKTVLNLNRILRWGAGLPLFDGWKDKMGLHYLAPERPLKTLIVENEGAAGMFHRQIGTMLYAQDQLSELERDRAKSNVLIWGDGGYSSLKLDDEKKLRMLRAGVEKHEPDLLFIEPFRSLWKGEENSSTEMSVIADCLQDIATDFDCSVILSHHERKSGAGEDGEKMSQARGSGVLEGVVTVMENFESIKSGQQRELSWSKMRYQDPDRPFPAPVRMEWLEGQNWYRYIPADAIGEAAMEELQNNGDEPLSVADLAELLDETKTKVRKVMEELRKDGRVKALPSVHDGGGSTGKRYRLPTGSNSDGEGLNF